MNWLVPTLLVAGLAGLTVASGRSRNTSAAASAVGESFTVDNVHSTVLFRTRPAHDLDTSVSFTAGES